MNKVVNLIAAMGKCIPELDVAPLYANHPDNAEQLTILDWIYNHLKEQDLIEYAEWAEYNGYIPELKPLVKISLSEEPSNFIFSLIEKIDWSIANIDPFELPYVMPWLEHINHYLKPHNLRLVDLLPFENPYFICIKDDAVLLQELCSALEVYDIDINSRSAMDQRQVSECVELIISE
ncbi:hypothetical protein ACXDSS_004477 [Klebsiella quasipneumoniae]